LVYLNFFLRQQARTLIVGTERQRGVLHRLLTLTLFGLFDPSAPDPVSFETARDVWGVDSREVYEFLLAAHQAYAVRAGPEPESPLLGIEDYVEFVPLVGDETAIALPGVEVRVAPSGRAFNVHIVQADGAEVEKLLEVGPARRVSRAIPEDRR